MKSQRYALELITAPAEEPVTLAQLRSYLRLTQTADDTELSNVWLPSARRLIEESTGLRLITQTWKMHLDRFPICDRAAVDFSFYHPFPPAVYFELPIGPTQSVSWIKYLDADGVEQTLATDVYTVDVKRSLARICLNVGKTFPATQAVPNAVRVQFVCGYGARTAVPPNLLAAVMFQARNMYDGEAEISPFVERLVALDWSGSLDAKI